jgi:F-type H+-transporting ATPase subunit epsilon
MITVLTDTATRREDIDEAAAEAERQLADRTGEMEVAEAQSQLMQAVAQLAAVEDLR